METDIMMASSMEANLAQLAINDSSEEPMGAQSPSPAPDASDLGVGGVGIVLQRDDEHKVLGCYVRHIEVGSSAYMQGDVQLFDVLMAVDGSLVEQMELEEIVRRVVGPVGSTVTLMFGRVTQKDRPELNKVVRATLVRGRPRMQLVSELRSGSSLMRAMESQHRALSKDAKLVARSLREASDRVTSLKDERESLRLQLEDAQLKIRRMESRLVKHVVAEAEGGSLQRLTCQELHERIAVVQARTVKAKEKMMENEKLKWKVEGEQSDVVPQIEQHKRSVAHMKEVLSYASPSSGPSKGSELSSSSTHGRMVRAYEDNIEELSRCILEKVHARQALSESMARCVQDTEVLEEALVESRRFHQGLQERRAKVVVEEEQRKKAAQDLEMKNSSLIYAISIANSQAEYEKQLLADAEGTQVKSIKLWTSALHSIQDLRVQSRESANQRIAEIGGRMGSMAAEAAAAHKALDAREEEVKEVEMRLMMARNKMQIERARLQQDVKSLRKEVEDLGKALEQPTKTLEAEISSISDAYEAINRCNGEVAASKRRFDVRGIYLLRLYAAQVLRTRMGETLGGERDDKLSGLLVKIEETRSMRARLDDKLSSVLSHVSRLSSAIDRFHSQTHDRQGLARFYLKERERLLIKVHGLFAGASNPGGESNRYFTRRPVTRLLQGPVLDILKYCDRDRAMNSELNQP
eukprot:763681-Hanusia_phi.AAC.5